MATRTADFTAFCRIFWIMLGPMLLALLTLGVVSHGNGWFTGVDIAFFTVLAGIILARWVEFRGGNPLTSTGEPAEPRHLRRFAMLAAGAGVAIWIVANLIGNAA